jgi:hypothetical protein
MLVSAPERARLSAIIVGASNGGRAGLHFPPGFQSHVRQYLLQDDGLGVGSGLRLLTNTVVSLPVSI